MHKGQSYRIRKFKPYEKVLKTMQERKHYTKNYKSIPGLMDLMYWSHFTQIFLNEKYEKKNKFKD